MPKTDLPVKVPAQQHILGIFLFVAYACALNYLRRTKNGTFRKWFLSIMGILDLYMACGTYDFIHTVIYSLISTILIFYTAKRCIHLSSLLVFTLMTIHRLYYHVTIDFKPMIAMRHMHITLKIIGLGFETYRSYLKKPKSKGEEDPEDLHVDPTFGETLHYVFSLAGTLGGSYIRYRTYIDCFRMNFAKAAKLDDFYIKLKYFCIASSIHYPLYYFKITGYFLSEAFEISSTFSKLAQLCACGLCHLTMVGMCLLSGEMINMCCGIGAYPIKCENKCGYGPTKNYSTLSKMTYEEAVKLDLDFKTIQSADYGTVLTTPLVKTVVRSWNTTVQFFLMQYFYRPYFQNSSSLFRIVFVGFISLVWHEVNVGYAIILFIDWPLYSIIVDPAAKKLLQSTSGLRHKLAFGLLFFLKYLLICSMGVFGSDILYWEDVKSFSRISGYVLVYLNLLIYSFAILIRLALRKT